MDKKRIILVSNGFYPEISPRSYRATELAKEFSRQGHDVTVITKSREHNYSNFIKENPLTLKMWEGGRWPENELKRLKPRSLFTRGAKRLMILFFEYPAIKDMLYVRKMLKNESGFDLMISFAVPYPVHWGVAWIRTKRWPIASTWVADCGDPYMGDVLDSFRKPFYFAYLEKWFCRKAEYISIPVESAIPAYYPEFHDKIRIIPQGLRFDIDKKESRVFQSEVPEFAYAGRFLHGIRDPAQLLEFLSGTGIKFKFYVFTDQPEFLANYYVRLGEKMIVSDFIPREELLHRLTKMDFLINFDNNTSLNVPSKLIDYSITGRPVLNIRKEFSPETVHAFLRGDYTCRMKLPDPMQYHINNVAKQFLDIQTS